MRLRSHRALSATKNLLQNRIILVTGASDGIGREAALTYSEYGASLILLGRNEEKLKAVAREIENAGGTPTPWYTLDLLTCTPASCQALAQRISTHYPRLDGVLHNAGLLGEVRPMDEQDPEIWQQVMQVNVNGTFFLTQPCFLYYSTPIPARWYLPPPAWGVRGVRTGGLRRLKICHRRNDAGAGRRVPKPPPAG